MSGRVGDVIRTREELDALPYGTFVECEIEEYEGKYVLMRTFGEFDVWITVSGDGEYTPELPARVGYIAPEGYSL